MTDRPAPPDPHDAGPHDEPTRIDFDVAQPARLYDYLVGGQDHFAVDREAGEQVAAAYPGGSDDVRAILRAFRAFLGRTLRYLVTEAGIRQFLDIGTGIQTGTKPHEVAQQLAPETRMVYVDPDPVALAHAHTVRRGSPEGATAHVQGDLRDVERVLHEAAATLDLTRPVAIRHYSLVNLMSDDEAYDVVTRLLEAVPAGSYLVVVAVASDIRPETAETSERLEAATRQTWFTRNQAEVRRFFAGTELVEPGVVIVDRWRAPEPSDADLQVPLYGGVGRKP